MKIIACVDSSLYSVDVAQSAVTYARAFGATLEFVHVFESPLAYDLGAALDIPALRRAESEAVDARLGQVIEGVHDVEWSKVELEGGPARSIVAHATDTEADLIIIGNRGRGELASLVLGSTSHGVIHAAPCDVVVIKAA